MEDPHPVSMSRRREFLALAGAALALPAAHADNSAAKPVTLSTAPVALPKQWSRAPSIPLWPGDPPGAAGFAIHPVSENASPVFVHNVAKPDLRVFRPARPNGLAVVVVPGGSYEFVSIANEGLEVAQKLTGYGLTVCVLTYRLPGEGWADRSSVPLQDAQRAMRIVRSRATQLAIDANRVSVLGFSAGGHLAATLATQHSEHSYERIDAVDQLDARPWAAGLIYPVVTLEKPWTHVISRGHLLGEDPSDADVARRSPDQHVDSATPPVCLVHAFDDRAVPVENSLRLMSAMRAAGRSVEAHLLQEGGHAFGTGRPGSPSEHWPALYASWLARIT